MAPDTTLCVAVRSLSLHRRSKRGEELSIFPTKILLATAGSAFPELASTTASRKVG
jgi:hypothetical protein